MIDEFVMDIREYASLVSGSTPPAAIILFSVSHFDFALLCAILIHCNHFEKLNVFLRAFSGFQLATWDILFVNKVLYLLHH